MVKNTYDAWGNILNKEVLFDCIASRHNPFVYKGYSLDSETNFYYLNSRYYNPKIHRFISIDNVNYLEPTYLDGINLYCYCMNNPISYADPSGHVAISSLIIGLLIFTGVMVVGGAVLGGVSAGISGGSVGDIFAGIGKGALNGLIIGGGISIAIGGFYIGGAKILGSIMATYGMSITANIFEVAVTQWKKSKYDGDNFWGRINDMNKAMFSNSGYILMGRPIFWSIPLYGTRLTSKLPTILNILVSYDLDNLFGTVPFYASMKSTLLQNAGKFSLGFGYGLTAFQFIKLGIALFGNTDFENLNWILY